MSRLALELDDRTLAVARDGEVLSTEPGVAFDGSGGEPVGAGAWDAQRRTPTHVSSRHFAELGAGGGGDVALTLVAAQLARHLRDHRSKDASLWLASPAGFEAAGLASVLAVVRQLGFRVAGFVDAAAVSAAALAPGRSALALEIGLHHVAVTAVECGAQARRRRALVSRSGGLVELDECWLDLVRAAMVKQTRFDPLHDAATDQRVFDSLRGVAREAAAAGSTTAVIETGAERFEVALTRDQFERAAAPVYREILRLFHELRHAGAAVTIIVPRLALDLPGLREALEAFRGCDLIAVADGFAAAAATVLDLPAATVSDDPDAVRLLRSVPIARAESLEALAQRAALGGETPTGRPPSHVLYEGRAVALDRGPLTVGRGGNGEATIALPEGLAGVSRRHCTIVSEGEHLVLVDHSVYGTYVNGERVAGRVRLAAGDRVRIGEPGVELSLIAVGT